MEPAVHTCNNSKLPISTSQIKDIACGATFTALLCTSGRIWLQGDWPALRGHDNASSKRKQPHSWKQLHLKQHKTAHTITGCWERLVALNSTSGSVFISGFLRDYSYEEDHNYGEPILYTTKGDGQWFAMEESDGRRLHVRRVLSAGQVLLVETVCAIN